MPINVESLVTIEERKMTLIKDLKIVIIALTIAFTVGACGGSSSGSSTTVVGLSTADNTQLLND